MKSSSRRRSYTYAWPGPSDADDKRRSFTNQLDLSPAGVRSAVNCRPGVLLGRLICHATSIAMTLATRRAASQAKSSVGLRRVRVSQICSIYAAHRFAQGGLQPSAAVIARPGCPVTPSAVSPASRQHGRVALSSAFVMAEPQAASSSRRRGEVDFVNAGFLSVDHRSWACIRRRFLAVRRIQLGLTISATRSCPALPRPRVDTAITDATAAIARPAN